MSLRKFSLAILPLVFMGCASVPTANNDLAAQAKQFNAPPAGKSGMYIYRDNSPIGAALKKDVWLDGECVGETARGVFFYDVVSGDMKHTLSTESEFSPNDLVVNTESGKNYFVRQSIKMGLVVGGAKLTQVDEAMGKEEVKKLDMAIKGNCNSAR